MRGARAFVPARNGVGIMYSLAAFLVLISVATPQERTDDPAAHLPGEGDVRAADSESWLAARERAERRLRVMRTGLPAGPEAVPEALPGPAPDPGTDSNSRAAPPAAPARATAARPSADAGSMASRQEPIATPRLSPADEAAQRELASRGYACSDEVPALACPDLARQIALGEVTPGVYLQCATVSGPVDFRGAWLKDKVCGQKAALIAKGGAVIENVTVSGQTIGVNAACVRLEGGDIVLRGLTCRDTDMGILGNVGHLVIENSLIERTIDGGRNYGHVVYINTADLVEIRGTTLRDPGHEGHPLKTGARKTVIESSVLEGGSRPYSRIIDAFNGGELVLRDTVLRAGSNGGNGDIIGFAAEERTRFEVNRVEMQGGVIDCRAGQTWNIVHIWKDKVPADLTEFKPGEVLGCPEPPAWWRQFIPGFMR